MHTVIAAYCIGCELCLPPCPVDCIDLLPPPAGHLWNAADARAAQGRYRRRLARLTRERTGPPATSREQRRETIAATLARAAARRERPR
jgi:electron transport complex protein RnfB